MTEPRVSDPSIPPAADAVEVIAADELVIAWQLRAVSPEQVMLLAPVLEDCPPILVRQHDRALLDGHMRLAAAQLRDRAWLPVQWFHGTDAEAYEAAVAANSRHGLPLTADARRTAVRALLELSPEWSNRRIARAAGVSEATVRRARRSGASVTHLNTVVGVDGKRYPARKTSQTAAAGGPAHRPEPSDPANARDTSPSASAVSQSQHQRGGSPAAPTTAAPRARWWRRFLGRLRRWLVPGGSD